jgi:phospholipid-binding lipoprotein MlaA
MMRYRLRKLVTVIRSATFALAFAGVASGCATLPDDPLDRADVLAANDRFEPANRMVFAINEAVDFVLLRPTAILYRDFMPDPGKDLVFNFVRHFTLPLTIVNDIAQGEWDRAEIASKRLFVNSIAGFGGVFDAATGLGLPHHKEDFGQTLATYQVAPGPYIVLPLIGPSSTRHAFGRIVDFGLDPLTYFLAKTPAKLSLGLRAVSIVDQRYRLLGPLDDLKQNSLDYYAAVRSLYRQRRTYEIRNLGDEATPKSTATVFETPINREG